MNNIELITPRRCCLVVIDPQERLMKAVQKPERVIKNINILLRAFEVFDLPIVATTQYEKGLGPIVPEVELPEKGLSKIDKTEFNCFFNRDFLKVMDGLSPAVDTLILAGVEAHICVFQTAISAMNFGFTTWVATDAVSSRSKKNARQAITLMQANSIFCCPTETVSYQLLKKAGTPQFKALLPHLK